MDQTINPLNGIVNPNARKTVPRPKWMCKHKDAILKDRENCIYTCIHCNPTMGTIKIIPHVSTKARSPKPVSVSPTITDTPGFS
jgi:hypothetical protein